MSIDFSDIVDDRLTGKTPLECAKRVELRMLRIFDRICKTYNLSYCLAYGTLLGAIRHKGFIPWDDDIDVHMPLSDYKKFVRIAGDVLPAEMGFYFGKATQCGFGKLIDLKSYYQDETVQYPGNMPSGIFIDIFPLRRYRSAALYEFTKRIVRQAILKTNSIGRVALMTVFQKWFWGIVKYCICYPVDFFNSSDTGKWTGVPLSMWGSVKILSEYPFPVTLQMFEGFEFPVPKDADKYLHTVYGDYMKLPPVEKRQTHARIIVPLIKSIVEES